MAKERREQIRKLPDKPLVGETYPNAGSEYRVRAFCADDDTALVENVASGWVCVAHHPALYETQGKDVELQWRYSTLGHFE